MGLHPSFPFARWPYRLFLCTNGKEKNAAEALSSLRELENVVRMCVELCIVYTCMHTISGGFTIRPSVLLLIFLP